MDGAPQTTFIPRKPVSDSAQNRSTGGNGFLIFGFLVLAVAIAGSVGLYVYQNFYLQKNLASEQAALKANLNQLDPNLISQMTTLSNQLASAKTVLSQHAALSNLFSFLASNTVASLRFTKFSYTTANNALAVSLDGQASSFAALDAQQNQLNQPGSILQTATVSSVAVTKTGTVTFTISGPLSMTGVSYANQLNGTTSPQ